MSPSEVREQVKASRLEQGLSETVSGPLLDDLAREVLGGGQDGG